MDNNKTDYYIVLRALTYCLIDIRATDNIRKANILADVFHNIPNLLASERSEVEIISELVETARRLECEKTITDYLEAATKYLESRPT